MHLFWPNTIGLMTKLVPIIGLKNIQLVEGKLKVQSIYKLLRLLKSSILGRVKSCLNQTWLNRKNTVFCNCISDWTWEVLIRSKRARTFNQTFYWPLRLRKNVPLTYIIIELLVASKRNYEVKIPTR